MPEYALSLPQLLRQWSAACDTFAPLKWLFGFHKTWNLNLHLIDIRIKLIAMQRVLLWSRTKRHMCWRMKQNGFFLRKVAYH